MSTEERIRVCARCRPLSRKEEDAGETEAVQVDGNRVRVQTAGGKRQEFEYDMVWEASATNDHVWHALEEPLLQSALAGFNVSLLAYGQTGSGKSHTLFGTATERGVVPRFCEGLFERLVSETAVRVTATVLELYNEKLRDLLVPFADAPGGTALRVRESPAVGPYVEGAKSVQISTAPQLVALMRHAAKNRTVAATALNETSSRAHAVVTIRFSRDVPSDQKQLKRMSTVNLVDLAGSERLARSQATGKRLVETGHINKSLATLAQVISTLAAAEKHKSKGGPEQKKTPQSRHVPYRDSQLTHLLRESLGGNARTTFVAAVSPGSASAKETLSTLRYASRARSVSTRARANEIDVSDSQATIRRLEQEVADLKRALSEERSKIKTASSSTSFFPALNAASSPTKRSIQELRTRMHSEMQARVAEYEAIMALAATFDEAAIPDDGDDDDDDDDGCGGENGENGDGTSPGLLVDETRRRQRDNLNNASSFVVRESTTDTIEPDDPSVRPSDRQRDAPSSPATTYPSPPPVVEAPRPRFVNLHEDPQLAGTLSLKLPDGETRVGRSRECEMRLEGNGLAETHAVVRVEKTVDGETSIELRAVDGRTFVNGRRLFRDATTELRHADRVVLGSALAFRLSFPRDATEKRRPPPTWDDAVQELQSGPIGDQGALPTVSATHADKNPKLDAELTRLAKIAVDAGAIAAKLGFDVRFAVTVAPALAVPDAPGAGPVVRMRPAVLVRKTDDDDPPLWPPAHFEAVAKALHETSVLDLEPPPVRFFGLAFARLAPLRDCKPLDASPRILDRRGRAVGTVRVRVTFQLPFTGARLSTLRGNPVPFTVRLDLLSWPPDLPLDQLIASYAFFDSTPVVAHSSPLSDGWAHVHTGSIVVTERLAKHLKAGRFLLEFRRLQQTPCGTHHREEQARHQHDDPSGLVDDGHTFPPGPAVAPPSGDDDDDYLFDDY